MVLLSKLAQPSATMGDSMGKLVSMFVVGVILAFSGVSASADLSDFRELRQVSCGEVSCWKGFVPIQEDLSLYVDYKQAKKGHPTIVLLNGMTYSTREWQAFVEAFAAIDPNVGILRYDMRAMGETLFRYGPLRGRVELEDQADDLPVLIDQLEIEGPVDLVGLSYGSAVAMDSAVHHRDHYRNIILMAPFLSRLKDQDTLIWTQINMTRLMQPWNPYSDDELYDYFLRVLVYSTYPLAEPVLMTHPYNTEAAFRKVQGARKWEAKNIAADFSERSIHLIQPLEDEYIPHQDYSDFWDLHVPERARASRLLIEQTKHKVPEVAPQLAAKHVHRIVRGDAKLFEGDTFVVNPKKGYESCESILRK